MPDFESLTGHVLSHRIDYERTVADDQLSLADMRVFGTFSYSNGHPIGVRRFEQTKKAFDRAGNFFLASTDEEVGRRPA
jgi:hypothetical protein